MTKKANAKEASEFAELPNNIAPELYLMGILSGKYKPDRTKIEIAKAFLPYRLPRLAQIEAVVKNVDYTLEDFLKEAAAEETRQLEHDGK